MTFWNVFFGVFAGIIAGVGIHLGIDLVRNLITRKKTRENLKFEIDFNVKKLDLFLGELRTFNDKVNADSIQDYLGYIGLSKRITTTIIQMFFDRSIYKVLKYEEIGKLQSFTSFYNIDTERLLNDQIRWGKEHADDPQIKQKAHKTIEFWKFIFEGSKKDLQEVKAKL